MVWHSPFTFVAGDTISYDDLNKYLYDNMNETLIGRIKSGAIGSSEGQWFSTNGGLPNSVSGFSTGYAESGANTQGRRTSTSYGAPTAFFGSYVNPSVTLTTGARALVLVQTQDMAIGTSTSSATESAFASVAVSGATTIAASDTYSGRSSGRYPFGGSGSSTPKRVSFFRWFTTLNPGVNTFTYQTRSTSDSSISDDVGMVVIPFG